MPKFKLQWSISVFLFFVYAHAIFLGVTAFQNNRFLDKKENLYYCFLKQVNVRMFDFLKIREKCRDSLILLY